MVKDFQSRWKGHQGMKMEKEKEIFPQRSKGGSQDPAGVQTCSLPSSLGCPCLEPFLQMIPAQSIWEPEPSLEGLPELPCLLL